MKASIFLSLAALARQATSTGYPTLQWDPDTAKDCVEWYNNSENESCESVRGYFGITPAKFHEWNPSVGLDCKPWEYQSYCIVTQEKINQTQTTTKASTTIPITTTSVATLGPSPTAWTDMGCYVEDPKLPILEQNLNPNGDASLTIPKCKTSCYRQSFGFAGVQQGNQCWCGSYVGGEWAKNQTACNTPCTGDNSAFCGGKGFVNVFKALENQPVVSSTGSIKSSSTSVKSAVPSKTGVAARNAVMLWSE